MVDHFGDRLFEKIRKTKSFLCLGIDPHLDLIPKIFNKNGTINNIDPIPIAIVHSAMTIWIEVLKNKYNLKNKKILSKNLLVYLEDVLEAFSYDADIKKSYYNWHELKNMS